MYRQLELSSSRINGTDGIVIESADGQSEKKEECAGVLGSVHFGKKEATQFTVKFHGRACFAFDIRIKTRFVTFGNISTVLCSSAPTTQVQSCCSGIAHYDFDFMGKWSSTSHPLHYPGHSTHWSNVIGATHSGAYVMFREGQIAQPGIIKMAEEGYVGTMERQLRIDQDNNQVEAILKTRAQWPAYQPGQATLNGQIISTQEHGYFSFTTMIGPSPDWFLGVDSINLCNESQCEWKQEISSELLPLDAGSDAGISYLSPNKPLHPKQPITKLITKTIPESPFSVAIEPFGSFKLKLNEVRSERSQEKVTACEYTAWSQWSLCSQTCGWGLRDRFRMSFRKFSHTENY